MVEMFCTLFPMHSDLFHVDEIVPETLGEKMIKDVDFHDKTPRR
jgi:hypothetical protein